MNNANIENKIFFFFFCIIIIISILYIILYLKHSLININSDIISIELVESTIDNNGQKIKWQGNTNIIPGQKINKITEIICKKGSVECYIRAKINIKCNTDIFTKENIITLNNLNIDKSKWYYCNYDGYWYYNQKLKENSESAILFTQIDIPENLDNSFALGEFEVEVEAEAIQAKNFNLDFSENSKNPWFGINESEIIKEF